ncbi:MAG: hypothetical protein KF745_05190 [Phycisphaeraceae bacterium]|nr:hypothetical protein [Phycisphaeraceae bacterium]
MASRFTGSIQRWIIIAIVVLVVGAYMTTYRVRFTETAVVTTFGKADESSVIKEAGMRFKIPYVQTVTLYDTRAKFLASAPETRNTQDAKNIVVTAFLTWQVSDALKFYQKYSGRGDRSEDHIRAAERDLQARLRSALGVISKFRLDEVLAGAGRESKMAALELALLDAMKSTDEASASFAEFGITPKAVGISSIRFDSETTKKVFDAMNANRAKIANELIAEGTTTADTIRKKATADSKRILDFAGRLAQNIRAQGQAEAAQYYKQMSANPELAIFLKNIDLLKEAFGRQTTLILPTSMPGMGLFRPDALNDQPAGVPTDKPTPQDRPAASGSPAGGQR